MESKMEKVVKDYEETVKVSINERISVDDRNLIDIAYKNFNGVLHRIGENQRQRKECDDDSIINDYKSIAEKELSEICDKVCNVTIKEAFLQQISHFQTTATASDDDDDEEQEEEEEDDDDDDEDDQLQNKHISGTRMWRSWRNKRKFNQIAPAQQHADIIKLFKFRDNFDALNRLADMETAHYDETIQFMEEILKTHKELLTEDEVWFINQTNYSIQLIKDLVHSSVTLKWDMNLDDAMVVIKKRRSDVEMKLQRLCKWMPNLMIKGIFLQHLDEFRKDPKPVKERVRVRIPYTINPTDIKELMIRKKKEMADNIAKEKEKKYGFHDHCKCIEEREEEYYPRFIHIGDWDPKSEGAIDLLSAPGRDSEKIRETFKAEYEKWKEEFNIP